MTDSQLASLSWCQAPVWDPWPIFLSPWNLPCWSLLYNLGLDHIENTACSVVASLSVATEICLPCRCLAIAYSSCSTFTAFIRRVMSQGWFKNYYNLDSAAKEEIWSRSLMPVIHKICHFGNMFYLQVMFLNLNTLFSTVSCRFCGTLLRPDILQPDNSGSPWLEDLWGNA
jgi:hypothetical protein